MIGQVFSLQLGARQRAEHLQLRLALQNSHARLLSGLAQVQHDLDALITHGEDLLALTGSLGAAVVRGDDCKLVGITPDEPDVLALASWLGRVVRQQVYHTDSLAAVWSHAANHVERASGALAISLPRPPNSFVIWFRPEVVQTLKWSGDPRKSMEPQSGEDRLHPRKSFELWKDTVKRHSRPWSDAEVEAAAELRQAILEKS